MQALQPTMRGGGRPRWMDPGHWPSGFDPLFTPRPFHPGNTYMGLPVITRHEDVDAVLRDKASWSRHVPDDVVEPGARHCTLHATWGADGETHTVLRRSMHSLYGGHTADARLFLHERTSELLALLMHQDQAWDLARVIYQVSMELTISHTLKAPMLLRHVWRLRQIMREHVATPGGFFGIVRQPDAEELLGEVLAERELLPRDGLAHNLVALYEAGAITRKQLLGQLWLVCVSHETQATATTNTLALLMHHNMLDYLRYALDDERRTTSLINEGLRRSIVFPASPVIAMQPVTLNGHVIARGTACMVCYGSANFDGSKFADPLGFRPDLTRDTHHMGFGVGGHHCQGKSGAEQFMEGVLRVASVALPPHSRLRNHQVLRETTGISLSIVQLPVTT